MSRIRVGEILRSLEPILETGDALATPENRQLLQGVIRELPETIRLQVREGLEDAIRKLTEDGSLDLGPWDGSLIVNQAVSEIEDRLGL